MWKLQVLGPVTLVAAESSEALRLGAKTEAVLACLAARAGEPCSRRWLIELLWADRSDADARNAFRQWLFHCRRIFGARPPVRSEGELVSIDAAVCDVDLWRFHRLAGSDAPAQWREACALFTGDLAEQLAATPEFDRWIAARRETVRSAARDLLLRMADRSLDAQSLSAASALAGSLIACDPLDEAAYRALMTLQASCGQRGKALETWRECRRALMAEVGAQPSAETAAVHERIQGGSTTAATLYRFPALRLAAARQVPSPLPGSDAALQAARDGVLGGLHRFFIGTAAQNVEARAAFVGAGELAPHAAQPGVLVAFTHLADFHYGWNGDPGDNFRRAAAKVAALRRRFPDDPLSHSVSGSLALWAGAYQRAIDELEIALAGFESPWIMAALADAQNGAGHPREALALVQRALELEPNDRGIFCTIAGMSHFAMGRLDAALEAFGSAVRRQPKYCVAHGGLAAVHAELGDTDAARDATAAATLENLRLSIDFARRGLPLADPALRERWAKAWSRAGMPEHERRWTDRSDDAGPWPMHVRHG